MNGSLEMPNDKNENSDGQQLSARRSARCPANFVQGPKMGNMNVTQQQSRTVS